MQNGILHKIELGLVFLSLISLLLKVFGLQGADIVMVVIFTTLAVFYFFFGFPLLRNMEWKSAFNKSLRRKGWVGRLTNMACWALSIITLGIAYTFLLLEGFRSMLLVGSLGGLITLLLSFFIIRKDHPQLFRQMLLRIPVFIIIGLILYQFSEGFFDPVLGRDVPVNQD